jgi:hypothetical protein
MAQMERRTPVFVVCSPLPHIGKTFVARLLIEYLAADGRAFAGYDVNPDNFVLKEQLPGHTATATVGDTKGQMALFDQLIIPDETSKVVDVGYVCFERFFTIMGEIGFEAEARRRMILPVVLLLTDGERRSVKAYTGLLDRFPDLALVPVLNSLGASDVRGHRSLRSKYVDIPLQIPFLSPTLKSAAQRSGFTAPPGYDRAIAGANELRAWVRRVFLQFRELELRLLLEELKPALLLRA